MRAPRSGIALTNSRGVTRGRVRMCTSRTCSSSRQSENDFNHLFNHPPDIQRATIVILGARGVGKTSLACQFTRNEFNDEYHPTPSRLFYYASVLINDRIYEVKLVDCSAVVRFPTSSLQEWNEYRGCGLRTASAYLLVYDVTDEDSFRYVRSMRDQILHSRNTHDVPIFVAANKQDLQPATTTGDKGSAAAAKRDLVNVVKKQWKCGFVECSTKHNWRVTTLFKELIRAIDHVHYGHRPASTRALQDALRNNRCVIL